MADDKITLTASDFTKLDNALKNAIANMNIGQTLEKNSIVCKVDLTTAKDANALYPCLNSGMPPGDALMISANNDLATPNGTETPVTNKPRSVIFAFINVMMAFCMIRGDWPSSKDNKIPNLIKTLLDKIPKKKSNGESITTEKDLAEAWSSVPCVIPLQWFIKKEMKFQSELIGRLSLNAAGHKFIKIIYKSLNYTGLTVQTNSEAYRIMIEIKERYKNTGVYYDLFPFSRSHDLPCDKFFDNVLTMVGTMVNDLAKDMEDFVKIFRNNQLREDELKTLRTADKTINSWKTWNPKLWPNNEVSLSDS